MNAGPDVEPLLSDWLDEEAPARAPDRILLTAADRLDHTRQWRFGVTWRFIPMNGTIPRRRGRRCRRAATRRRLLPLRWRRGAQRRRPSDVDPDAGAERLGRRGAGLPARRPTYVA